MLLGDTNIKKNLLSILTLYTIVLIVNYQLIKKRKKKNKRQIK